MLDPEAERFIRCNYSNQNIEKCRKLSNCWERSVFMCISIIKLDEVPYVGLSNSAIALTMPSSCKEAKSTSPRTSKLSFHINSI